RVLASPPMRGPSITISLSALCTLAIACGPPPRGDSGPGDDGSGSPDSGLPGDCAKGTEFVYVIDQFANQISQFDPATKTFHDLGPLNCPISAGATPFSMG